jgi:hypothetical protein
MQKAKPECLIFDNRGPARLGAACQYDSLVTQSATRQKKPI